MKKTILFITFTLVCTFSSFAQDKDAYKDAVSTMFQVSGSEAAFSTAIDQMFNMFKVQYPDISEETWLELKKEFDAASMDDLVERMVPIYQKHLTLEGIQGVIAFYRTPVGQKYAEKTPLITQESMQIGQQWGMEIGKEFARRMTKKGY